MFESKLKIVFLVDCVQRYFFFERLSESLGEVAESHFLTTEPLCSALIAFSNKKGRYLRRGRKCNSGLTEAQVTEAAQKSIDVLNKMVALEAAKHEVRSLTSELIDYYKVHSIERIVVWNGQQIIGRAATIAAAICKTPMRYLEISNLPNKIISDSRGVGSLVSFREDFRLLDSLEDVSQEEHDRWVKEYENYKKNPLPQSRKNYKEQFLNILNYGFKVILRKCSTADVVRKIKRHSSNLSFDLRQPEGSERYIFLPLQVSSDTQIKLHSKIDNLESIEFAVDLSRKEGCCLFVKIHPAESDSSEIFKIVQASRRYGFHLTNANTTDLLKGSQAVVVINSTVGLESLIYNKKLIVLGDAYYEEFNQERLRKFVHSYLVGGVDYFSTSPISFESATKAVGLI